MNILVTGANGFVGRALIPRLLEDGHTVFALVRSRSKSDASLKGVQWLEGDLLRTSTLPALPAIDHAFYLVHGLKEDAANFEYRESVAALSFLNWIRESSPAITYLGGLVSRDLELSAHLRSRHMTGAILGASGLDCLELRASIILGDGSLSFEIIKALSERLPFRPDFSLLSQECQPLALGDLLKYLEGSVHLGIKGHRIVEIGGPTALPYGELLDLYADVAGLKRKRIKLPQVETKVMLKALDYAIPEHSQVGRKLAESLEYPTIVTDNSAEEFFPTIKPLDLRSAMDRAQAASTSHYAPLWEKDFLRVLLSDKILIQSGLLSPELMRNLEKVGKIRDLLTRK